ncbi:MAG: tryptophan--tRNA ligase [Acholeplasmataceae bacterium]
MRLVSGIKPTGGLTLGNYIGAIKQFVNLQNTLKDTEFFIFIADLHAITTPIKREELKKNIKDIAALYLACGLDPNQVNLFVQSDIPAHSQLAYVMESTVYMGEIERMTQFKDKRQKQEESLRSSLFTYPALMAADILLYDADIVPVGEDQTQHLELTRTLAQRFNHLYGETFVVPKAYHPKTGARIKSLTEPTKKMAKTDESPKSYILLLDDIAQAKNKIRSAVTDSEASIYYDPENKPGISNLLTIYASLENVSIEDAVLKFKDSSYKDFKEAVAVSVENTLKPIQDNYARIMSEGILHDVLDQGQSVASKIAYKKISKVYKKIGFQRK